MATGTGRVGYQTSAYLNAYPGLTPAAARAAAAAQDQSERLKLALAEHPDTFGGAWFDPYAATYHIAVTTPAARSEVVDLVLAST